MQRGKTEPLFKNEDNWDKISLEVYKEMYSEAKLKYDEMLSQSESVSTKSQVLLLSVCALAAWSANNILKGQTLTFGIWVLISVFIIDVSILIYQFLSRKAPLRGTMPSVVLEEEEKLAGDIGGDNYNDKQKDKLFFYYQLHRYQQKYGALKKVLGTRVQLYNATLVITFLLFCGVVASNIYFAPRVSKSSSSAVAVPGPCNLSPLVS